MYNEIEGLPRFINKKLNFDWLYKAYRFGDLYNTLSTMKKEDATLMLHDLDYEMQQLSERKFQNLITEEKYKLIIDELSKIKIIFMKNLSDRIEKFGSLL